MLSEGSGDYTLTPVTSASAVNVITVPEFDSVSNSVINKYYRIDLTKSVYGSGANTKYYKWQKDSQGLKLVETTNSSEAVLTLKYGAGVSPIDVAAGTVRALISGDYVSQSLKNAVSVLGTVNNVNANFVGNTLSLTSSDNNRYSSILSDSGGQIDKIDSTFIGNNVTSSNKEVSGALVKALGGVGTISSDFLDNTVTSNAVVNGGLISTGLSGNIDKVTSSFVNNWVYAQGANVNGALIYNQGTLGEVSSSEFINNGATSTTGNVYGGVISNAGTLSGGVKNSLFSGNYIKSTSGAVYGGAIYNDGLITGPIVNTSFVGNYASSSSGTAQGGAIYTTSDIGITADGQAVNFAGNYVESGGKKTYQDIYVDSRIANVNLDVKNNGSMYFGGGIDGLDGFNINITGDSTGVVKFYGDIGQADLKVNNVTLDLADGVLRNYNFATLNSDPNTKYVLDVNFGTGKADNFTVGTGSSGTIYINDINLIGEMPLETRTIKILNSDLNDNISIAVRPDVLANLGYTKTKTETWHDEIPNTLGWGDEITKHERTDTYTASLSVTSSNGKRNDSITQRVDVVEGNVIDSKYGDTLKVLAQNVTTAERNFVAAPERNTYTLAENIGSVSAGTFNVKGVHDSTNWDVTSEINAQSKYNIFTLDKATNLGIYDVNFKNLNAVDGSLLNITNKNAVVTLENVTISEPSINGIINNGTLNLSRKFNINTGIIGNGILNITGSRPLSAETQYLTHSITQDTVNVKNGARLFNRTTGAVINAKLNIASGSSAALLAANIGAEVTNSGSIDLTGSTLKQPLKGSGTLNIYSNITLNNVVENKIRVASGCSLTSNADYIKGTITLDGSNVSRLTLTGGTLAAGANISGSNTVYIIDDVVSNANITAGINIASAKSLTIDTSKLYTSNFAAFTNYAINNGILNITNSGDLLRIINGTGTTYIKGNVIYLNNPGNVINQAIVIDSDATLSLSPSSVGNSGSITNNGTLNFAAGTLNKIVTGTGITNINSDVIINQPISTNINISSNNSITLNPANLRGNVVNNAVEGVVFNASGTYITPSITGTGSILIQTGTLTVPDGTRINQPIVMRGGTGINISASDVGAGISGSDNSITLRGGTLSHDIKNIRTYYSGNVIVDEAVRNTGYMYISGSATIIPQNFSSGRIELTNSASKLYYNGSGSIQSVYGVGTVYIKGNIQEHLYMNPKVVVESTGTYTSNMSNFGGSSFTNQGKTYIYGDLSKNIAGAGTTYVSSYNNIGTTFKSGAAIEGVLNLNSSTIQTINQAVNTFNVGSVAGTGNVKLDFDVASGKSDMFNLANTSTGKATISEINLMNVNGAFDKTFQIFDGGKGAQVVLNGTTKTLNIVNREEDTISANVEFGQTYAIRDKKGTTNATLSLATTDSTNDSIRVQGSAPVWTETITTNKDLLADWISYSTTANKSFTFKTAKDVYTSTSKVLANIGNQTVNITGVAADRNNRNGARSTLAFWANGTNNAMNLVINSGGRVNISDVKLADLGYYDVSTSGNAIQVNTGGVLNLDNVNMSAWRTDCNVRVKSGGRLEKFTGILYNAGRSMGMYLESGSNADYISADFTSFAGWHYNFINSGTVTTLENSLFANNHYANSAGKSTAIGLHNTGTITNLSNNLFNNNSQSNHNDKSMYSAAFSNIGTITNFSGNNFTNNFIKMSNTSSSVAYGYGPAFSSRGNITNGILNSTFKSNYINGYGGYGGAVHLNGGTVKVIDNVTFGGGTLNVVDGITYGGDDKSLGNYIIYRPYQGRSAEGGALHVNGTKITEGINNSHFINNYIQVESTNYPNNANLDIYGGALSARSPIPIIKDTEFIGNRAQNINGSVWGGAVYGNVTKYENVTFSDNHAITQATSNYTASGGAIFVTSPVTGGISGTFTANSAEGNYGSWGGAIRSLQDIAFINGRFEKNYSKANKGYAIGGALALGGGTVKSINADFIGNYTDGSAESHGGAIDMRGAPVIQSLSGLFEGNYVTAVNSAGSGGAIQVGYSVTDKARIDNLSAIFRGNYSAPKLGPAVGGAIHNRGTITKIENSLFEGNYVISTNSYGYGAAIYNHNSNVSSQLAKIGEIRNTSFINNYILAKTSAIGAAIFSSDHLKMYATDGYVSRFSGNYYQLNGGAKNYEAIYLAGNYNLTLDTRTGGKFLFDDYIRGSDANLERGTVLMTGDGTGSVKLNNDIRNMHVSVSNTLLDVSSNNKDDFNFISLTSAPTAKYKLDVNLTSGKSDNFTLERASSGVITIDDLVFTGSTTDNNKTFQIIKAADKTDNIQLAFGKNKYGSYNVVDNILNTISDSVKSTDVIRQAAGIMLSKTNTENDSFSINNGSTFDTLYAIAQKETSNARTFSFAGTANTLNYSLTTDLVPVTEGSLSINGVTGKTNILDANSHKLFTLNKETALNINNTRLLGATDLITVDNAYATVNLNNADICGNIKGNANFKMNIDGTTNITGTVTNANTTFNNGNLSFGTNTFANAGNKLSAVTGTINLNNDKVENYTINNLTSTSNVNYVLDMNLSNKTIDKIKINSGSGTVKVDNINFMNNLTETEYGDYLLQVLDTPTSSIQLALSDEVLNKVFNLGSIRNNNEEDTILATTNFNTVYHTYYRLGQMSGKLSLDSKNTLNDSIKLSVVQDWNVDRVATGVMGDTLKLVAQADMNVRTFEASSASDTYIATDDIGLVSTGQLIIAGTADGNKYSTVNFADHKGFILGKDTSLSLNNINLIGSSSPITVNDSSATIELNNVNIRGDINGSAQYNMNISGNGLTTINGIVNNANATLTKGGLTFNSDTFAAANTSLNLDGGYIYLNDNALNTYQFTQLRANTNANWAIDVDLQRGLGDTINVRNGSGIVTIDALNIIGEVINTGSSYVIPVIVSNGNNVQLRLSDTLSSVGTTYKIGSNTHITQDTINPITKWNTVYHQTETAYDVYGSVALATKVTTNDSLRINVARIDDVPRTTVSQIDTLKALSSLQTSSARQFNFEAAENTYIVTNNIGSVTSGTISINGVKSGESYSTINADNYGLFELDNVTTLNLSNVRLSRGNNSTGSLLTITNDKASANLSNVIVESVGTASAISNAGTLNVANSTIHTGITGTGNLKTSGTVNLYEDVTQTKLINTGTLTLDSGSVIYGTLENSGTANISASAITRSVLNTSSLNLQGGTLAYGINGSGRTNIKGNVNSFAAINQQIDIAAGAGLTSSASDIGGNVTNASNLTFSEGTLTKTVTGSGRTNISGNVTAKAKISQAINILADGALTANASNLGGVVSNSKTLNLIGGTLAQNVSGTGTVNIQNGTTILNSAISNNIVNLASGTLKLNSTGNISGARKLVASGGALSLQDNTITNKNLGNLELNEDLNISIDANLSTKTADQISASSLTNEGNHSIIINSIKVIADAGSVTTPIDILVADSTLRNIVKLTTDQMTVIGADSNVSYLVTYTKGTGMLTFDYGNLATAVALTATERNYTMSADENVTKNLGALGGAGATLTINGGGHVVNLNSHGGVTISDGQTMTVNNVSNWKNSNSTNGGAFNNSGSLNITDTDFANNTASQSGGAISNSGTTTISANTKNISFSNNLANGKVNDIHNTGTLNLNTSSGKSITFGGTITGGEGTTNLNGPGTVNFNDVVTQNKLNINSGIVNVSADDLKIAQGVTNKSTLNLSNGTLTSSVAGTGTTNITGTVTNNSTISQNKVNVSGTLTSNAGNLTSTNGISNTGTLNLTGGALGSAVSGAGTTNITGTLTNNSTISQNKLNVSGSLTSNAGNLTAGNGISNTGTLNLTGGALGSAVSGSGTTNITGTVTNNSTISQNKVNVSGSLTSNAGNLTATNGISNTGTLNLTGGALGSAVSGSGTTNITGTLTNNSTISQNKVNVSGSLTSNAGNLTATNGISNTGTLNLTGGALGSAVSGAGTTNISGTVTNNSTISQNKLNVSGNLTSNAGNLTATNGISNTGTLNLTGGALGSAVSGSGTTNITGTVTNNSTISQNKLNVSGSLTSNAGNLTATNGISNTGTLNLTGGTLSSAVSGAGSTNITGTVANNTTITQNNINISGTLTSNAGNLVGNIHNGGTLNLSGGTTQGNISNYNNANGTINVTDSLNVAHSVENNTINLNNGTMIFTGNGDISGSNLVVNGGNINLQDNKVDSDFRDLGNVTLLEDLNLSIDVDLANVAADRVSGTMTESNGHYIIIDSIKILSDALSLVPTEIIIADNGLKSYVKLAESFETTAIAGVKDSYLVTYSNTTGKLTFAYSTLATAVASETTQRVYTLSKNETVNVDLGAMGGAGASLTIAGNNHVVNLDNHSGVIVSNAQTLNINNVIAWKNSNSTNGGAVKNSGSLNITDTDFTNNTASQSGGAISNSGTTTISANTKNISFSNNLANGKANDIHNTGTLNLNTSSGKSITFGGTITGGEGTTNLNGSGTVNFNDVVTQNKLNINSGIVNVSADDLKIAQGVTNKSTLNLTGGALGSAVSGTGTTNITGTVTNNTTISQNKVNVSGSLTSNAGNLTSTNGISNTGTLNLTGGALGSAVSGTGTTNISGTVTNNTTISQNKVNVSGNLTSNAGNLTATNGISNTGTLNLTGGALGSAVSGSGTTNITGTVTNNSTISQNKINVTGSLTSNANNIIGSVANSGTLNFTGGITQGNIDNFNSVNGTVNVLNNLEVVHNIQNNTINLNNGTMTLTGNGDISNSNLVANGGSLSVQDNKVDSEFKNLGSITLLEDLNLAIDVNLANQTSDKITGNMLNSNGHYIIIDSIKVLSDALSLIPTEVIVADNSLKSYVKLAENFQTTSVDGVSDSYLVTYSNTTGKLTFAYSTLATAVASETTQRVYTLSKNETVNVDLGAMGGDGATLTITGNGFVVDLNNNSGTTVAADQTLNINNVGAWKNSNSTNGGAFNNSGSLNITDTDFANNTASQSGGAISNSGTTTISANTKNISFSGNLANGKANDIHNTGTLNLNTSSGKSITFGGTITGGEGTTNLNGSGTVNFNDVVTQNKLNINSGIVNVSADDLKIAQGVTNKSTLNLSNGTLTSSVSGTGTTNISGTVTNNTTISQNKVNVSGNLTSNAGNLTATNGISNTGTLNLTGGALGSAVSGTGTTNITGTVTNNTTISQNKVNVSGSLTSNAGNLTATNGISNTGTLNLTGGTLSSKLTGNGTTNVQDNFTNDTDISQDVLNIAEDKILTNNSEKSITVNTFVNGGTIANSGNVTLNGETTNAGTINGNGALFLNDNLTNSGTITQDRLTLAAGKTLQNLSDKSITINGAMDNSGTISNAGALVVNGSGNLGLITGSGNFTATGSLTNNSGITQGSILNTGTLVSDAAINGNLTNRGTLDNNAKLTGNITNELGASLNSSADNLIGTINNSGTLILEGGTTHGDISGSGNTVIQNTVTLVDTVTDNTVILKDGATLELRNDGDISNSTLQGQGGTLDIMDSEISNTDLGNIDLSNGSINLAIDVDLKNHTSDTIEGNLIANNNNNIIISSINLVTDSLKIPIEITVTGDDALKATIKLGEDIRIVDGPAESYMVTYSKETGALNFNYSGLGNAIHSNAVDKVYNMVIDENLDSDLGLLGGGENASLIINGDKHNINGNRHQGIIVDDSQSLTVNDVNKYEGFETAIINKDGGTVNIKNVTFENNDVAINNEGLLNLKGDNKFNDRVIGENGSTVIQDGNTAFNNYVEQKDIQINEGAALKTNADYIKTTEGIKNNGTLTLSGGENKNTITGKGTTDITSYMSNKADIDQVIINITEQGYLDNSSNIKVADKFTNKGTIYNNSSIDSENFINKGTIINNKDISLGSLENTGSINNDGAIYLNTSDSTNTGSIMGNGEFNVGAKFENKSYITQSKLVVSEKGIVNTNSENFIANEGITNNGVINYTSGRTTVSDITGSATGNVNLNTNGDFIISHKISGTNLTLNNGVMYFGKDGDISQVSSFNVNGGGINVIDNKVTDRNLGNVNLNKKSDLSLDFNIQTGVSDSFTTEVTNNGGTFNVKEVNIIGEQNLIQTDHLRYDLSDTTKLGANLSSEKLKLADITTPIRRLSGTLQNGVIEYKPSGSHINTFNPSVMASSVATQIGGYFSQVQTLQTGFYHMDRYSLYPRAQRQFAQNINKSAIGEGNVSYQTSPLPETSQAMWSKPYTTFETVSLRGGVKVNNIAYGSFYGGDSNLKQMKNGWSGVLSSFVAYNGNNSNYSGISMNQEGGSLGLTGTFYKGNFFTGLTLSAGGSAGEAHTQYGKDHFNMVTGGIANKTGYNWEIKEGKFIVQPSLFLGYTVVKTIDYRNSAGVKLDSDPLYAMQISPGIKFIGNLANGWQPYADINMMWNIMSKGHVQANNIDLPQLSVKPYIQYGLGLQKTWGDRFTAYGQAMMRNGGRNGVVLSAGFRWTLGKSENDEDKQVKNDNVIPVNNKKQESIMAPVPKQVSSSAPKIIKQMSDVQKAQYTTRTSLIGSIK